jgi:UDPglucose 6-dehydrogenase
LTSDVWAAMDDADCAALVTRHREYQALDVQRLREVMRTPALVDGRNVFEAEVCRAAELIYRGIGKKA